MPMVLCRGVVGEEIAGRDTSQAVHCGERLPPPTRTMTYIRQQIESVRQRQRSIEEFCCGTPSWNVGQFLSFVAADCDRLQRETMLARRATATCHHLKDEPPILR